MTPTKSQKHEKSINYVSIQDFSPKELRLLTPKKLFNKESINDGTYDVSQNYFGSLTCSISPGTKSYVSQFIQLPSPNNTINHKKKNYEVWTVVKNVWKIISIIINKKCKNSSFKKTIE